MVTSTPFGSPLDVYNWIYRAVNLERGQSVRSFRLDRMKVLSKLAGHPEKCAPAFHVAGSKGKGSVTGMIAAILEASGIKTARYASPHVSDFRERIGTGGGFFDGETYIRAGEELKTLVDNLPADPEAGLFDPRLEGGEEPTFFELMTMWFFLCARLSRVDALAVETGMGGRLDSTNILDPLASVITLIELEHTDYLGNTVAAIAGEKAGIVKPGRPLILAEQSAGALEVFKERAAVNKAPLLYFPDCAGVEITGVSRKGVSFTLTLKSREIDGVKTGAGTFPGLFVPMPGAFQAANAGLAVLAVTTCFPGIPEKAVREGLAGFTLPARFERVSGTPLVIIDGAHTRQSAGLCLETFCGLYGTGGVLIFGCAAGKDLPSMAELCVPCFSRIIITAPGTFKKSSPEDIYAAFTREAEAKKSRGSPVPEIILVPDTAEAVDRALRLASETKLPLLGTGSFYLAAEIRDRLKPPAQDSGR